MYRYASVSADIAAYISDQSDADERDEWAHNTVMDELPEWIQTGRESGRICLEVLDDFLSAMVKRDASATAAAQVRLLEVLDEYISEVESNLDPDDYYEGP